MGSDKRVVAVAAVAAAAAMVAVVLVECADGCGAGVDSGAH